MEELTQRFTREFKESSIYIRGMKKYYQTYWNRLFKFYNNYHGSTYWGAVIEAARQCGYPVD